MTLTIEQIEILLLLAAIISILARKFKFPYTVGLVLSGIILSMFLPAPALTKELIYSILLPPLLFEAAIFIPWRRLHKELLFISVMATMGVIISAVIIALGLYWILHWPFLIAGIFGALIAATDPASVIAIFRESGVNSRLRLIVEAESLFNDGTSAVMFGILLAIAGGATVSPGSIVMNAIQIIGGGVLCGGIVAFLVLYLAGKTSDHLVEITFTTMAAYGSFLLAEHLHCSGILSTITAGLIIGNRGLFLGSITSKGKEAVEVFWEYLAFVSNSLIFLLIGIHEAKQAFLHNWLMISVAIFWVIMSRALTIFPISFLFHKSSAKIRFTEQVIMFCGSPRGALSLALALGLPADMPYREQIISATFAVVAFSVIVQGISIAPLVSWLKSKDNKA